MRNDHLHIYYKAKKLESIGQLVIFRSIQSLSLSFLSTRLDAIA